MKLYLAVMGIVPIIAISILLFTKGKSDLVNHEAEAWTSRQFERLEQTRDRLQNQIYFLQTEVINHTHWLETRKESPQFQSRFFTDLIAFTEAGGEWRPRWNAFLQNKKPTITGGPIKLPAGYRGGSAGLFFNKVDGPEKRLNLVVPVIVRTLDGEDLKLRVMALLSDQFKLFPQKDGFESHLVSLWESDGNLVAAEGSRRLETQFFWSQLGLLDQIRKHLSGKSSPFIWTDFANNGIGVFVRLPGSSLIYGFVQKRSALIPYLEKWNLKMIFSLAGLGIILLVISLSLKLKKYHGEKKEDDDKGVVTAQENMDDVRTKNQGIQIETHDEKEVLKKMSNMLNSPLTAILGNAQLGKSKGSEQECPYFQLIEEESRGLRRIIDQILRYTRAETIEKSEVDVLPVVERAFKNLMVQMNRGGIQLRKNFSHSGKILGNSEWLYQILVSVLQNSIEGLEGGIEKVITVSVAAENKKIFISIQDTGPGIKKDKIAEIFTPFYSSKGGEHLGLGLSSALGMVESLGGNISVQSAINEGAKMTLVFPVLPDSVKELAVVSEDLSASFSVSDGDEQVVENTSVAPAPSEDSEAAEPAAEQAPVEISGPSNEDSAESEAEYFARLQKLRKSKKMDDELVQIRNPRPGQEGS